VAAVLLGLTAVGVVLAATRQDPGATVDSGEYLSVADSLRHGNGLTMPYVSYDEPYPEHVRVHERVDLTQYPPLYPAALAAVGGSALSASRWLNALALGGVVAVVVLLLGAATGSLAWAGAGGALLVSPTFVYTASMTWSEPLMLLLYAGTVAATVAHVRGGDRRWLWAAVVLAGLCSMARFTGLAAGLGVGAVTWLTCRRPWRSVAVTAAAVSPEIFWFARNTLLIGAPSEKPVVWHPPGRTDLTRVLRSVTSWFVRDTPDRRRVVGIVLLLVIALTAWAWGRAFRRGVAWDGVPAITAVFGTIYVAFLLAARAGIDNNIDLSTRHLAVVELLLVTGGILAGHRRKVTAVVAALVVVSATFRLVTATVPEFPHTYRSGYTSDTWDRSAGLAFVRTLPSDTVVVTNAPDAVWLRTDRRPLFLPLAVDLYAGGPNRRYEDQLTSLGEAVRGHHAVLVFFERPTRGGNRRLDPRAARKLALVADRRLGDSSVYSFGSQ
jgi:hypothetical protein